jgi:hypothetical protein
MYQHQWRHQAWRRKWHLAKAGINNMALMNEKAINNGANGVISQ